MYTQFRKVTPVRMATVGSDLIKLDTERFPLSAGMHVHDGIIYPAIASSHLLDNISTFSVKPNDWILATYAKSGTTWAAEILHQIARYAEQTAGEFPTFTRFPYIEFDIPGMKMNQSIICGYKTHLTVQKLPNKIFDDKLKVVVVLRNPKDIAVSMYYMYQSTASLGNFSGGWDTFFDMFVTGNVTGGSWFHWVKNWYTKCTNCSNVLFITYEVLKQNPMQMVQTLGNFLGIALSDSVIAEITKLTSFGYMKENPSFPPGFNKVLNEDISPFFRKGEIGDWKTHFTVKQNEIFDQLFLTEMKGFENLTLAWEKYMK